MSDPLQVLVVGAGYFSQFHLDAWQRMSGARLASIVDPQTQKHAQLATDYPLTDVHSTLEQALQQTRADIIDIVTPPATHDAIVRKAMDLSHGEALLVCQKPFCTSVSQARTLAADAARQRRKLVVHENFRFQPWYAQIRSMLEAGELGTVLQAVFRLRPGDGRGADAYLQRQPYFQSMPRFLIHETGIHWIDTFRYLFGEPESLYADLQRLNPHIAGEDAGSFVFRYASGLRAVFDGNRLLDHAAENRRLTMGEMSIEGSAATLELNGDGELLLRRFGELEQQAVDYRFEQRGFAGDAVFRLNQHIVQHLREGEPLYNSAADYLRNLELEELVYRSAQSGRRLSCAGGGASVA